MIDERLRDAWNFHREHAGYSTPPGRAACALELARAEREMQARGWYAEIIPDEEAPYNEGPAPDGTVYVACLLRAGETDGMDDVLDSLWGIDVASESDPYLRVVAAELAREALHEARKIDRAMAL